MVAEVAMIDPQPSGFLTLFDAFERYCAGWPEQLDLPSRQRLTDRCLIEFKTALEAGDFRVKVFFPDRAGEYEVPPKLWSVEGFPELQILHEDVVGHAPRDWAPYIGRSLFVREEAFTNWLAARDAPSAPATVPPPKRRKKGRRKGSRGWDTGPFEKEYRRRLEAYGMPSKQNVDGWTGKTKAAATVLGYFYEEHVKGTAEPPSQSAAWDWAQECIRDWQADGSPRDPEKSGN